MIKKSFSVTLSLVLCFALSAILAVICFTIPSLIHWYFGEVRNLGIYTLDYLTKIVCIAFYACMPFAAVALFLLIRMLFRIRRGDVFTAKNVSALRGLSWCCVAVAVITLVAGIYYLPLIIVCAAAGFIAIILRVVKNAFAYAVDIKNENELTI